MGSVQFYVDGTSVGMGTLGTTTATSATFTLNSLSLTVGTHSISAVFTGSGGYQNNGSNIFQQVQEGTTTSLSGSGSPTAFAAPPTFTAVVTDVDAGAGTPTGGVEFFDNGNPLGSGTLETTTGSSATFTLNSPSLTVGSHNITATFFGSGGYQTSPSNTVTQQVQEATTTSISSSSNPSAFATPPTFIATVADVDSGAGPAQGSLEFFLDGTALGTGSALSGTGDTVTSTFTPSSPLTVGTHTITAVFTSSGGYLNSDNTRSPLIQSVKEQTTITVSTALDTSLAGNPVVLTARVTDVDVGAGTPTGSVEFFIDGSSTPVLGSALSGSGDSATSVFVTSSDPDSPTYLGAGTHTIVAEFIGTGGSGNTTNQATPFHQVVNAPYFAVGADAGGGPQVVVYNAVTGALVASFDAFAPSFTGGVRVAVDEINGSEDIICAAGPGGGPQVTIYSGNLLASGTPASSAIVASFDAFSPSFTGGVFVAAGTSSSGQNWIAAGAGAGGGPQVIVYTSQAILAGVVAGTAPTPLTSFFAFAPTFTGGVTVALGDVLGTGKLDVIAGAGPGGGPQVIVVNGTQLGQIPSSGILPSSALLANFYAFAPSFTGGVFVSGGVTSGTPFNLIIGAGAGGSPQVVVVDGADGNQVASNGEIANSALVDSFFALSNSFTGGVRVGFNGAYGSSGTSAILAGAGPGGSPQVAPFSGDTFAGTTDLTNFYALPQGFSGGLFIAG